MQINNRYDEEIARLRHELEMRGGSSQHVGGPAQSAAPHPQPPNIGNGQGTLFGTIIQNQGGSSSLAPPNQDQQAQQHGQPQPPPPGHTIPQPGPPGPQPPFGGYGAPNGELAK